MDKTEVKTINQLRGFEGHIAKLNDGTEQIQSDDITINGSGEFGQITKDDLQDLLNFLVDNNITETRTWIVYTGFGGYMTITLQQAWDKYGNKKLPRKMKKKYFKDKKSRRRYLPQYYKNQNYYKY